MSTHTLEARWDDAIRDFEVAQRAAGYAESTIANRVKHVRRFAGGIGRPLARVTYEDLRGWLDRETRNNTTRSSLRSSLRSFYGWACAAGRCADDPSLEPEYVTRKLPVPELWRPVLDDFRAYLRANAQPRSTVGVRLAQMGRFARDHASLDPLEVQFEDLVDWLSEKRWKPETRRSHRSVLRLFYDWLVACGRLEESPATKLPVVRRGTHLPRPALDDEYARALAFSSPRERIALILAAELGLRCGEVVKVHSKHLTQRDGEWFLAVVGKGSRERLLPLTANHVTMLRSQPSGYVFPGRVDGHMSGHYMGKLISRLLPEGVTMHALRHRFATRAYAVNNDVFAVQQLLGHASAATTQVYVRVDESRIRGIVEAVSA